MSQLVDEELEWRDWQQEQQQHALGGVPGVVEMLIGSHLTQFVYANKRGWVFGVDTDFEVEGFKKSKSRAAHSGKPDDKTDDKPGRKQPDVAFVSIERLPGVPRGVVKVAPDLVVEVYSENDSPYAMSDKVKEYLAAGVKLVWVVNPANQVIEVHQPVQDKALLLGIKDEIDGGEVLPGFMLKLQDVFGQVIEAVED